jgi:V/A-type H+-transporting ATPase subunit I
MLKVTIVGQLADKDKVIESLQDSGCVQVVNLKDTVDSAEAQYLLPLGGVDSQSTDTALSEISSCIAFFDKYQPREKSLLDSFIGSKVPVSSDHYGRAVSGFNYHSLYRRVNAIESRLSDIRSQESRLASERELLSAWAGLDLPLEQLRDTDSTDIFAAAPAVKDLEPLRGALAESGGHAAFVEVSRDSKQVYVVLFMLKRERDTVDAMKPFTLSRVSFADLKGTAVSNLMRIESGVAGLDAEERALEAEVKQLYSHYNDLLVLYDELGTRKSRTSVQMNFLGTGQVFAVQGWVRKSQSHALRDRLEGVSDALVVEYEDPGPDDRPPVVLENSRWVEPFEIVTTIYGLPGYTEADPTPLLAPFFFVFFGLALSDAAYGILLALISAWALKKLDIPWAQKKLFRLMVLCGISTVVFGAMLGSWFGNLFDMLPASLAFVRRFRDAVFVFDPLQDPLRMLIISLALGILQVWFGLLIKMRATIKQSGLKTGLLDQGTWLFFLGTLVFMILAGTAVVSKSLYSIAVRSAQVGAVMVIAAQGRGARSWIAKPFLGLYGLYSVVSYFSDVLSYSRLLALGLATTVIANVVNQMGQLVRPVPVLGPVVMLAVLAGGHAFNLLINILGSFIHAGRLQFVEFFTKFFEGGGKAFRPFQRENRYTTVRS